MFYMIQIKIKMA